MKQGMKALFIFMLIALISVISACGTAEESAPADEASNGGQASEQPEANTEGDAKEEPEKKVLKVATDAAYAPFEYLDKGKIVGVDIDWLAAIMEEAGYEYEVENTGWDPLFAAVQGENVDLAISAITINDDRKETYDFSVPYFESTNMILVPKDSNIKSAQDLKGKVVAVQNGTTGQEAVEKILGENHENIKKFENNTIAITELLNGGADAVVADNTVVQEFVKNNPDKNLKTVADPENFDSEFYGLMFPKGSELKPEFDAAIKAIIENGTYAKIYKKWLGEEPNTEALLKQQ